MATAKILAFAWSARQGSYNKKQVKIALVGAKAAGAQVTYVDFRDLLPLYDLSGVRAEWQFERSVPTNSDRATR